MTGPHQRITWSNISCSIWNLVVHRIEFIRYSLLSKVSLLSKGLRIRRGDSISFGGGGVGKALLLRVDFLAFGESCDANHVDINNRYLAHLDLVCPELLNCERDVRMIDVVHIVFDSFLVLNTQSNQCSCIE